jgi:YidC/Oxa1 family membrane protein insertase
MDEDRSQNRRLILAAGLCLLVMLVWQYVFPPPRTVAPPKDGSAVVTSTAAQETATATRAATPAVAQQKQVPLSTYETSGSVMYDEEPHPYQVQLTNAGGGIERWVLPSYKERDKDNRPTDDPIKLADSTAQLTPEQAAFQQMAGIRFLEGTTFETPPLLMFEVADKTDKSITYRHVTEEGVEIERYYEFKPDSFVVEMAVTVRNNSSKEQSHKLEIGGALVATEAMKKGDGFFSAFVPPPDHLQALCYADGEVERHSLEELQDESETFKNGVQWVAVDRQYFTAAMIARDREVAECRLDAKGDAARAALVMPLETLRPGGEKRHKFTAYLGVKKPALLTQIGSNLEAAIDYKILGLNLAPLCTGLLWILGLFHKWTSSWGLAILGLTVLVKLILFPLNQRSGKSMRAVSALKPQMDAIREKFADDKQRQSEEMMRLYREHNVNPAGGCLPILIQMPIWFALYRSLWVSVDLYQQGFLWIDDLTTRDPLWILPVALVIVMFLQQKMTPTTMDPAQQKMMQYTMPLLFGAMMTALPAGLCFYILVNTLLTIVQQHFINKSIGPIGGPAVSAQGAKA